MTELAGMTRKEICDWFLENGHQAFRGRQVFDMYFFYVSVQYGWVIYEHPYHFFRILVDAIYRIDNR